MGSFGYRARLYGNNGIVASGHVIRTYGESVYSSTGMVGFCAKIMVGGSVDAAFVQTNNNFQPSNYTAKGTYISSYVETPFQGANVFMEGKYSNHGTRGTIYATNVTVSFTNPSVGHVTLTRVIKAKYPSRGGDSGGIVYSGSNNIYGIHEGSSNDGFTYFISASEINRTMNLTTY